jgi:myosin heavy subunit
MNSAGHETIPLLKKEHCLQVGVTKIFFKAGVLGYMEETCNRMQGGALHVHPK